MRKDSCWSKHKLAIIIGGLILLVCAIAIIVPLAICLRPSKLPVVSETGMF